MILAFPDLCQRRSDGSLWRASFPSDWSQGAVVASLLVASVGVEPPFSGNWYFRGVRPIKWTFGMLWKDTGEIWQCNDGRKFDVIDSSTISMA